jgi:hypothetical protein
MSSRVPSFPAVPLGARVASNVGVCGQIICGFGFPPEWGTTEFPFQVWGEVIPDPPFADAVVHQRHNVGRIESPAQRRVTIAIGHGLKREVVVWWCRGEVVEFIV